MFSQERFNFGRTSKRIITIGILVASLSVFVWKNIQVISMANVNSVQDFNWYYYAFRVALGKIPHSELYNVALQHLSLNSMSVTQVDPLGFFGYPPQFAVLLSPFGSQSLISAKIIWTILNSLLYVVGLLLISLAAYSGSDNYRRMVIVAAGLLCSPLYSDILLGQVNRLLFFLLSLSLWMMVKPRWKIWAGVPLAAAVMIKVIPLVVIGVLAWRREWRTVTVAVLCIVVVTLLTVHVLGFELIREFLKDLPYFNRLNLLHGAAPWNNSFLGVMSLYAAGQTLTEWQTAFRITIVLCLGSVLLRSRRDYTKDMAVAVVSMLLLTPAVEVHYLTLAVIPELVILGNFIREMELRSTNMLLRQKLRDNVLTVCLLMAVWIILIFHAHFISYFCCMLILLVLCGQAYGFNSVHRAWPWKTSRNSM